MLKIKSFYTFTFLVLLQVFPLQAAPRSDSWDVLRQEFKLPHHLDKPSVQYELKWLLQHRHYLHQLIQAKPYLYHIITQVKALNLPGELGLIPMLESAYNPFAYSKVGAAGLWQLMPKTGEYLGVKGSWWTDDRRSIVSSTQAALNYFSRLHDYFKGDWLLAIAAYDCGEGTVMRLMKQQRADFWQLPFPHETLHYVPRLLALAELIAQPEHYGLRLPAIPYQPYFQAVHIPAQLDLALAAEFADISYKELIYLNPGFNHSTPSLNQDLSILLPRAKVLKFQQNLLKNRHRLHASLLRYQVKVGDTLDRLASIYHSRPEFIRQVNHLTAKELSPGQIIYLPQAQTLLKIHHPSKSKPLSILTASQYKILHIVQQHESMEELGKKYQVNPRQIMAWNHRINPKLEPGEKLVIWRSSSGLVFDEVKVGDSLQQIANRNHLSLSALQRFNPGLDAKHLQPGQKIKLLQ